MKKSAVWLGAGAVLVASGLALARAQDHQPTPPMVSFAAHSQSIPFELFRGNRIVVPATLNGHQTDVLLDTGASITTVDSSYARRSDCRRAKDRRPRRRRRCRRRQARFGTDTSVGGVRLSKLNSGVLDLGAVSNAPLDDRSTSFSAVTSSIPQSSPSIGLPVDCCCPIA